MLFLFFNYFIYIRLLGSPLLVLGQDRKGSKRDSRDERPPPQAGHETDRQGGDNPHAAMQWFHYIRTN